MLIARVFSFFLIIAVVSIEKLSGQNSGSRETVSVLNKPHTMKFQNLEIQ
jgi:hypothetical protein